MADAFDAMTSGRCYRDRMPLDEAVLELKRGSGTQFAPEVVEIFLRLLEKNGVEGIM